MSTTEAELSPLEQLLAISPIEPYVRILARLAEQEPTAPAITFGGVTVTRAELESLANRTARAFAELGVGFGDFVTIGLPNSVEFYSAFIATLKLGAVPQPVSPKLPAAERAAIVELADSTLVVGAEPGSHGARTCLPVGFVPDTGLSDEPLPELISPAWKAPTSGGSTGRPKLIVAGTGAEGSPILSGYVMQMTATDVQLVCGPLYHNAPMSNSISGLLLGQHIVVLPHFDAVKALEAIETYGVTWVQTVPTMMLRMQRVLEGGASYDLSSIRIFWHMASKCPEWLKEAWIEIVGAEKVYELYGGTEMQSVCIITGTQWLEHRGSVGQPLIGEMRVLNADYEVVPAGEVGEIYMRRPEGAAATYKYVGAEATEHDGWESLGDLGWMDADGYVYIHDRRVDMINSGGANVYPAEVEAALESSPKVLSAVVVGLPDHDLGYRVHALVQAEEGTTGEELSAHLAESLVRYKIPRSYEFIDAPLRDDAGKARRSAMRDEAIARMQNV